MKIAEISGLSNVYGLNPGWTIAGIKGQLIRDGKLPSDKDEGKAVTDADKDVLFNLSRWPLGKQKENMLRL